MPASAAAGRRERKSALIIAETDSPYIVVVTLPACRCGCPIPLRRVVDAEGRGKAAVFHSDGCREVFTKRATRAANKKAKSRA